MSEKSAAVVIGVGSEEGLGATLAKYFAKKGLHVFVAGRSGDQLQLIVEKIMQQGNTATTVVTDATVEQDVEQLFTVVEKAGYPLALAVYNAGNNIPAPLLETDSGTFINLWQNNCFGGFLFGKQAIATMKKRQEGTLIFTGATASLRGKPPFTAFGVAKAGLRALAQGMAREFGPEGIHVAHIIIDGVIDGENSRRRFPNFVSQKGKEGLLQLDAIAETYWAIHQQHSSAWTHELDLRPFKESF